MGAHPAPHHHPKLRAGVGGGLARAERLEAVAPSREALKVGGRAACPRRLLLLHDVQEQHAAGLRGASPAAAAGTAAGGGAAASGCDGGRAAWRRGRGGYRQQARVHRPGILTVEGCAKDPAGRSRGIGSGAAAPPAHPQTCSLARQRDAARRPATAANIHPSTHPSSARAGNSLVQVVPEGQHVAGGQRRARRRRRPQHSLHPDILLRLLWEIGPLQGARHRGRHKRQQACGRARAGLAAQTAAGLRAGEGGVGCCPPPKLQAPSSAAGHSTAMRSSSSRVPAEAAGPTARVATAEPAAVAARGRRLVSRVLRPAPQKRWLGHVHAADSRSGVLC